MKKNLLMIFLLACTWLAACSPAPTPAAPTVTPGPTSTATQTPLPSLTPTITLTPTPSLTPTPTATPTVHGPFAGIHLHDLNSRRQLNLGLDSGMHWTRFDDFNWLAIEPVLTDPPTYNWNTVDESGLANLSSLGFEAIGIILFTPEWAQKLDSACGPVAEEALDEFARFAGDLVRRYSQPPYNVKHWEIGNEPDIAPSLVGEDWGFGCWGDLVDPYYGGEYYGRVLKSVYPAMKAADPQATVLVGGLSLDCDPRNPPETTPGSGVPKNCTPSRFLEGILVEGSAPFFDGVSFHTYDYYSSRGVYSNINWNSYSGLSGPVVNIKVPYLRALLEKFGAGSKPLYNTEVSLLCGRDGTEAICQEADFLVTKAAYAAQANAATVANGVNASIWYSITGWRASGMVDRFIQPLDVYRTFTFSVAQLQDVRFIRRVEQFPGLLGYEFARLDKTFWVIWSLDGLEHALQPPGPPTQVFDMYGERLPGEGELQVGFEPVYIEWQAP